MYKLRFQKSQLAKYTQKYNVENKEKDAVLFGLVTGIQSRGYMTKDELRAVANWKSPRSERHIEKNDEEFIGAISSFALSSEDERARISALTLLDGVQWPTASVLLHFFHQDPYPILDFRALWSLSMEVPPQYNFKFWWSYTEFCLSLAKEVNLDMRSLDQALWQYSLDHQ
jgi:hypothetical protein